jgi:hypothetical protein
LMEPYATLLTAATLLYSSYHDIRTREVDDRVWIIPAAAGILINTYPFLDAGLGWLIRYGLAAGVDGGRCLRALLHRALRRS